MKVSPSQEHGILRLSLGGHDCLDATNASGVRLSALRLIDGRQDVVVDLSGIQFIDSAGIGVLIGLYKHARKVGCRSCIVGATREVRRVLELIQLDRIFTLYDDVPSAARAMTHVKA